ncbi:MAG: HAD-IA family hydrolase, partial [Chloroflexota bacterium]|nr:HAD-IA family hydrolase [Chloroflexota bacterium]
NRYSEAQIQEMMERKNNTYRRLLREITESDFLPGARKLMADIRRHGLKMAVGSASKNTGTVLQRLGIAEAFDTVADGYSTERGKPAPDLFLYAAAQMDVPPDQCIVVEDARSGVQAALAAGMVAVGIGPVERVGDAHFRYSTTVDIDLDQILAELN